jgi:RNA polymerase sigma-70 factor (ECF subfamily)
MDQEPRSQRLSRISTLWTLVHQAHQGGKEAVSAAQKALLERYSDAVYRYLLGALRDRDAADELFQEFSLRFLRGDFKNADPGRGQFRKFVKTVLFHLVVDYRHRQQGRPRSLNEGLAEPALPAPEHTEAEQEFLKGWREELIERTWLALEELERKTGQPVHTILRFRFDHPMRSSAEMAEQLGARLGQQYTVNALRQALKRARDRFGDLLLREVEHSLENPTVEQLQEELTDLGLLSSCLSALQRRGYS